MNKKITESPGQLRGGYIFSDVVKKMNHIAKVVEIMNMELNAWNGCQADYEEHIRIAGLSGAVADELELTVMRLRELKRYMTRNAKNKENRT